MFSYFVRHLRKKCLFLETVAFYSANALTQLLAAKDAVGNLKSILDTLSKVDLLIIDKLGYLELTKKTGSVFPVSC